MPLAKLAIDTGYETAAVYAWARIQGIAQVAPVKGMEGFNRTTPVSGPTFVDATVNGRKLKRGARLWTVATATFKAETYRYLRLERPNDEDRASGVSNPAGTIHLPDWADSEWLKQLVAEQLVTIRNKRGYARQEWQKMRERNEALDTRVYARAAVWILGADRFDERMWRQLEKQAGVETITAAAKADTDTPSEPQAGRIAAPRKRGWRVSTPKYME
jgi:phage terminase large subunit GpA-like protein